MITGPRLSYGVFFLAGSLAAFGPARAAETEGLRARAIEPDRVLRGLKSPRGLVSVIVKLDAEPLAAYDGGLAGLAPTSPQATRAPVHRGRASVRAYERYLAARERAFSEALVRRVPRARVVHRFRAILGGVSVVVPRERVAEVRALPGVKAVYEDVLLAVDTDRSPEFIGAPALWARLGGQGKAGQGQVVGVVDTGIWPESPSVRDDGTFPPPPPSWTGTACEIGSAVPGDLPFACDRKLVGARRTMSTFDLLGPPPLPGEFASARDNHGHGTHTATTAAGNGNVRAGFQGQPLGVVSGIAPRAHLAVYKACFTDAEGQGLCYASDAAAAVEQAVRDGVDVLSFSIGGGREPFSDPVSLAFLDAYAAGVFVACSAGNAGPSADTVEHREPWTTTVAATTTDKRYHGSASLTGKDGASLEVEGVSTFDGLVPAAPAVLASEAPYADPLCLAPASPGALAGTVVACRRGGNARAAKSANVAAGGAAGMILYNASDGETVNADVHSVPTVHVDAAQGAALVDFLETQDAALASLAGVRLLDGRGDVVAPFSSRGGPGQELGLSKPDVAAPGVDVLAGHSGRTAFPAGPDGQLFAVRSGTSMAAPHVAGAAALLLQLHPDWGPGDVKSALMTTATDDVVQEDGATPATPFDVGSGRIDLSRAGRASLLVSETAPGFVDVRSNLSLANTPSLYLPAVPGKVAVPRRLRNALRNGERFTTSVEAPADVRIEVPRRVRFRAGETREVWMAIDASAVPVGEVRHARVLFRPAGGGRGDGRGCAGKDESGGCGEPGETLAFPITLVRKDGGVVLAKACDETTLARGETTECTITATNTANAAFRAASVVVRDWMPRELRLGRVEGARRLGPFGLVHEGTLAGGEPPGVIVGPGSSPLGYLPLRLFGIPPVPGVGDETIVNFTVPEFAFAGQAYSRLGVVSNGYVVLGGGTAADVSALNQRLPDPVAPNDVLAPFWTDLDPSRGGALRVASLTDGVGHWIVVDWENVRVHSPDDPVPNSFQAWIETGGTEGVAFAYGNVGAGDGGRLTVGAENAFGNRGAMSYHDGAGTRPGPGADVVVTGTPGAPGGSHVITFEAIAHKTGEWVNCAEMSSDAFFGTATSCVPGEVTKRRSTVSSR